MFIFKMFSYFRMTSLAKRCTFWALGQWHFKVIQPIQLIPEFVVIQWQIACKSKVLFYCGEDLNVLVFWGRLKAETIRIQSEKLFCPVQYKQMNECHNLEIKADENLF